MNDSKIDGDYIEALLNRLVSDYKMTWELLSDLLGVEKSKLKDYKKYEYELFNDLEHWSSWTGKALMLDYMSLDSPDSRFKAYLELLVDGYKISTQSIAKLGNIDEQYVIDFYNDKIDIPVEIKYKLSSSITQLVIILKHTPPTY